MAEKLADYMTGKAIGTLPEGSMVLELPPFSHYLVVHPTLPPKVITWQGKMLVLEAVPDDVPQTPEGVQP